MPEVWYRGEMIGGDRATPGSTADHDLGDGMYVTDNEHSAREYAQLRTPDPDKQRVYAINIDRSSLRVLDLTTDARWQKHIAPMEDMMRQAPENYGRTFNSFREVYKIDLSKYDAVIGLDYQRGGRQMCLLYKNGRPTQLHVRIRGSFRPLTSSTVNVRAPLPEFNIRVRPVRVRVLNAIGEGGAAVLEFAIPILLALVEKWAMERALKNKIKKGLEDLQPQIDDKLTKLKPEIAKMQLLLEKGEKVYAVVTVEVGHWTMSLGAGRGDYPDVRVTLADIEIASKPVTSDRSFERTEFWDDKQSGQKHPVDQSKRSFEMQVFSDQELETFRDLSTEYLSYKRRLMMEPSNQVFIAEERRLRELIVRAYGKDIWYLQP